MFDCKITHWVVFHAIQSRLCKKNDPMAGTLALMLADYLRDRHSTCTLLVGIPCVSLHAQFAVRERQDEIHMHIYTNN